MRHEFSEIDEGGESDNMVSFRIVKTKKVKEEDPIILKIKDKENLNPVNSEQVSNNSVRNSKVIKNSNDGGSKDNSKAKILFQEDQFDREDSLLIRRREEKEKRVFWSKEKIEYFRLKCKTVKEKILQKQTNDFKEVRAAIMDKDVEKVKSKLLDPDFIDFYKLELKKCDLLEYMLLTGQTGLLLDIIKDEFYSFFDYNYIFGFLQKIIKEKHVNTNEHKDVVMNIIKFKLYDQKMHRLIIWLIGILDFNECFR